MKIFSMKENNASNGVGEARGNKIECTDFGGRMQVWTNFYGLNKSFKAG